MKAMNFITDYRKVFAFLVIVCSVFLLSCCEEPPIEILEPKVELLAPENVTGNSATLVASANPASQNLIVSFECFDGTSWVEVAQSSCSGNQTIVVKKPVANLEANKEYTLRVLLLERIGQQFALIATSNTKSFKTLNPPIISIAHTQATYTDINLRLTLIPKESNIKVQVDYTVNGQVITKTDAGSYSGETPVTLNFKLDNLVKDTKYSIKVKAIGALASSSLDTTLVTAAVTDFDGNYYRIVKIGNQTWLMDNFRGTHFANGDPIPYVSEQAQWDLMKTPAYCWYNNDPAIGAEYGGLYNWYVANDPRGLIVGYHTPEISEWLTLADYLGGVSVAGGKMKEAGNSHWQEGANTGATNSSGFTALPAGGNVGLFYYLGESTAFWSNSKQDFIQSAYTALLNNVYGNTLAAGPGLSPYNYGLSLRLIKN